MGVQAKRDFMPMISRDDDMIFSTFGFIGSHAVWFYNGTLLFVDLDLSCFVSCRVCLGHKHVYCVECYVQMQCEQPKLTAEPIEPTMCTPCSFDRACLQNLLLNTCFVGVRATIPFLATCMLTMTH